jgi:hypothetical protein
MLMMNPPERLQMGDLLGNRTPFRIPLYQRGYAWQSDELEDFVGDIQALLREAGASHFFGGVLSVRTPAPETRAGSIYELVDGQQRVTTFTLLVKSIVDAYGSVADEATIAGDEDTSKLARSLQTLAAGDVLSYEDLGPGDGSPLVTRYRLQLSRRDEPYFQQLLDGTAPNLTRRSPHSHKLLARAAEDLRTALVEPITANEELAPAQKLVALQDLLATLTTRCYVIHITTDDREEAYTLFTVLNDRGRSLTDGDLLRTRTLELLEGRPELQNQAEESWDDILKGTPTEVRGFLRAFYASHQGTRWPSKDLHKELWRTFFGQELPIDDTTAREVVATVRKLAEENRIYRLLLTGAWPVEDPETSPWDVERLFRLIKVLRGQASIPLLLSVALTREERFFAQVVGFLERFTFRYNIAGGHASQLGDRYYDESRKVRNHPDTYTLEQLESALGVQLSRYGSDELFRANLVERINYRRSPGPLLKHFFTTLDDYGPWLRRGADGAPKPDRTSMVNFQGVEIEHIYPQRPRTRVEGLASHVHELGNLTFWAPEDNRSASNAPFVEKKPKYLESRVDMTKAVGSLEEWSETSFAARQEQLLDDALKVWAFDVSKIARPASTDGGTQAWFVQQNPDSRYRDREGEVYDYPYAIPNAQQIVPGDVLVCYRAQRASEDEQRIFGLGVVETIVPDGERLLAVYGKYAALEPPRAFSDVGGDPRNNRRNAINQLDKGVVDSLLRSLAVSAASDLPGVDVDVDDLVQLGVEPLEELLD